MTTSPRVVFFGNERLVSGLKQTSAPILTGLIERGYDIVAVVVNDHDITSRSARRLEVADIAATHNIPVWRPQRTIDILSDLEAAQADCAILSAYGRIIPQRVIDVFAPHGIINIHPSLLPRHRGSTPIETTILNNDTTAGVSIMQLTAGMDEGPIFGQVSLPLRGDETKFVLHDILSQAGADLLFELLPDILNGRLSAKPQQSIDVSHTTQISKQDGIIDPATDTAATIERKVRAYLGYPKSRLCYQNDDVIITSAKVVDSEITDELVLRCKDDSYLLVESLIAPSGRQMPGSAYLRGLVNKSSRA